ncbi:NERD domain-containing protein [Haloarchaeobius litoreus]|uniref:NERD domain-containing protein n=1 Tax=Haloarchaeobius litoreus TaxID=755306 RepID=A0ABD6DLB9_9EURY|nr:nuclease-related domain-containing DEAD/DEAH box helicase [Haloarchaeobius litoreus]
MEFIASGEGGDHAGVDAERTVWRAVTRAFGPGDRGVAYWRYPIVSPDRASFDREADFVLLHEEFGLVVVECKGYRLDHVAAIEGDRWRLQGTRQSTATPYTQARDHGFRLLNHLDGEPALSDERGNPTVPANFLVALPNVERDAWDERFGSLPSAPPVLTADELTPGGLRDRLAGTAGGPLDAATYGAARAVLSGGQPISGDARPEVADGPSPEDASTKAELYEHVAGGLKRLDAKQEAIGLQIPDGPQQIRGIAGSGKSVLLAQKAAQMHARHPDWRVVVTFQTRSLYPTVIETIRRYHEHYTGEDPDWDRLQVLHGWGGRTRRGLYYEVAQATGVEPRTYGDARSAFDRADGDLLAQCCDEVLDAGPVPERYDAILVDEAQDFEPPFFRLAYAALEPPKRLVWAYDEAQSLQTLSAPRPTDLFGTDPDGTPRVDLQGSYEGGVQKSQVMRTAYRTPRPVLMLAHVFGMGLLRDGGAVQALTTQSGWEDIGYEVEGDFRQYGSPVTLRRPAEHSPHPLAGVDAARPFVVTETFADRGAELDAVADAVRRDVTRHGLAPERIAVVVLGPVHDSRDWGESLADRLRRRTVEPNLVWDGDPDVFDREGAVTISRVNRAKGNQAAQVYIVGLDTVADGSRSADLVQRRNEAFVALTRTKAWCTLTGVDRDDAPTDRLFSEFDEAVAGTTGRPPVVTFPAPEPANLQRTMVDATLDAF